MISMAKGNALIHTPRQMRARMICTYTRKGALCIRIHIRCHYERQKYRHKFLWRDPRDPVVHDVVRTLPLLRCVAFKLREQAADKPLTVSG